MATLERIRRRSGLLIIVIGLAMLAFILTDLLGSGNSILRNDATKVGFVNGEPIEYQEFNRLMDERLALLQQQNPQQAQSITRVQLADQIWLELLQDNILGERYENLGISVSPEELFESIKQNPQIQQQQSFKDPVTGRFSAGAFKQYVQSIKENAATDAQAASAWSQWLSFEAATKEQLERNKYLELVRQGLYMPKALAIEDHTRQNELNTISYFGLTYESIPDSSISVEESDMRAYYNEHKSEYKKEATADIAFVSFRVQASQKDRNALQNELKTYLEPELITVRGKSDTLPSFYDTEDDSAYAVGRSDFPVNADFVKLEELQAPLDSAFFQNEAGHIEGPYEQNGNFVLTKISTVSFLPDSVKARHVLISYQGANNGQSNATRSPQEAKALADSLLEVIKADSTQFDTIARQFSDGPTSTKGGRLGWFGPGQMVPSFGDFCFQKETGAIGMVFSQFGIHLVNIQEQAGSNRALKLVHIRRRIEASDATRDSIYNRASNFAGQINDTTNFSALAQSMGFSARVATDIEPFQENILGIGNNREIVRWAHGVQEETPLGAVELFNQENRSFIVTQLTAKNEAGIADFESVKEDLMIPTKNKMKADLLKDKIAKAGGNGTDLKQWASALGVEVKSQGINFTTANLTGFGSEPKVIGAASVLPVGTNSEPIAGARGVYVVQVNNRTPAEELPTYDQEKVRLETAMQNLANNQVFESLKEAADIEDNRARFY
jgi:parvulin-like peptidyl-prolyl isomerase